MLLASESCVGTLNFMRKSNILACSGWHIVHFLEAVRPPLVYSRWFYAVNEPVSVVMWARILSYDIGNIIGIWITSKMCHNVMINMVLWWIYFDTKVAFIEYFSTIWYLKLTVLSQFHIHLKFIIGLLITWYIDYIIYMYIPRISRVSMRPDSNRHQILFYDISRFSIL